MSKAGICTGGLDCEDACAVLVVCTSARGVDCEAHFSALVILKRQQSENGHVMSFFRRHA